jgi:hypothetical protein
MPFRDASGRECLRQRVCGFTRCYWAVSVVRSKRCLWQREAADGWRYSLGAPNLPSETKGWRGQCGYIDAGHWVHARVEDVIRTGKDTGLGHSPPAITR